MITMQRAVAKAGWQLGFSLGIFFLLLTISRVWPSARSVFACVARAVFHVLSCRMLTNALVYVCAPDTLNAWPQQAKDLRERLLGPSGTCVKLHLSGPRPYSVLLERGGSGECMS